MKTESKDSGSAIEALGPLFKLTQISIWDTTYSTSPKHIRFKYDDDDDDDDEDDDNQGVTEEMALLGLPLSFQTNKQNRSGKIKGKNKVSQQNSQKRLDEQEEESCRSSEEKPNCADFQVESSHISSLSLPNQSEQFGCGSNVTNDTVKLHNLCEEHTEMASDLIHDELEEHVHDCSILNPAAEAANDDSVSVDLRMEIELTNHDDLSNLTMTNTSSGESSILDDHLEDDMSLNKQFNAQSLILGTNIIQHENSGSKDTSNDMVVLNEEYNDNGRCFGTCGDWSAYWDSFYSRYFFYNTQTTVSTWDPPSGMESFAFGDESCVSVLESDVVLSKSNADPLKDQSEEVQSIECEPSLDTIECSHTCGYEMKEEDYDENSDKKCLKSEYHVSNGSLCENSGKNCDVNIIAQLSNSSTSRCGAEATWDDDCANNMQIKEEDATINDIQMVDTSDGTKRRSRRRHRRRKNSDNGSNEIYQAEKIYIDIEKYWCQRYQLFSKFDEGIKMDEEGWFSVTPEAIAKHHASRSGRGTIIDCFTGVGGNAIQFAKKSKHVIAIDIDADKIDYASHNAGIYRVDDKINFVVGDSFVLASKLKADTVFLSPPWGGPDYLKVNPYSLQMLQPYDGQVLFDTFKGVARLIIMFLPRNVDIEQLAQLALSDEPTWSLEVEKNVLNGKFKAVTAYFRRA